MITLNTCPTSGLAREAEVISILNNVKSKTITIEYVVYAKNGDLEVADMRKTSRYVATNANPVSSYDWATQAEWEMIGEYDYMDKLLDSASCEEVATSKLEMMNTEGTI